jgi:hypothetical protein
LHAASSPGSASAPAVAHDRDAAAAGLPAQRAGAGWRQVELGASSLTRVNLRVGPFRGRVVITAGDRTLRLLVARADAYRMHASLFSLCNAGTDAGPPVRSHADGAPLH